MNVKKIEACFPFNEVYFITQEKSALNSNPTYNEQMD